MLGFEDPCIALVLNFPSDKEGKRSDGFAVWHVGTPHILPLKVNREAVPLVWLYIGDAQPFLNVAPKTNVVSTFDEEVAHGFHGLLAKGAKTAIWPTSFFEPIRRPNPFLISDPCEELRT
jgi:hypothetical protein